MAEILLKAFIMCLSLSAVSTLECLDPSNSFVDWFSTYKAPKIGYKSSFFKLGTAHYYLDLNSPAWALSKRSINDSDTALYNTLHQIYGGKSGDFMYLMYNDERPGGSTSTNGGHTKGVVGFDGQSGFWLIHSVPKFPPSKNQAYSYPHTGTTYGQTFLCISLPYKMLGSVAKQLLYNQPHIYSSFVPKNMINDFPILNDVLNKRKPDGPPWYSVLDLQSIKGQNFTSFAKSTYYGKDLYADLVAPKLAESLLVETWMDGAGVLPNNCTVDYKIYNIAYISLPDDVLFKRSHDHSKWATANLDSSTGNGPSWTCIGDINRMSSQFHRGGGTVCIDHAGLWKTFRTSVSKYVPC